jgi:hypothetical protein
MSIAFLAEKHWRRRCGQDHPIPELFHLIRMISEQRNAKNAALKFIQRHCSTPMWSGMSNVIVGLMTN